MRDAPTPAVWGGLNWSTQHMRNLTSRSQRQSQLNLKCQFWVCLRLIFRTAQEGVWKITHSCMKNITTGLQIWRIAMNPSLHQNHYISLLVIVWLTSFVVSLSQCCDVFCKCLFLLVSIKLFWWCLWLRAKRFFWPHRLSELLMALFAIDSHMQC